MRLAAALAVVALAVMMVAAAPRGHPWHVWERDSYCVREGPSADYRCMWVWSRMPRQYETLTACTERKQWLDAQNSDVEFTCSDRAGSRMIEP